MAEGQEQNRSEAPTPFKLKKAREKGTVARSTEVGFVAGLIALTAFALMSGATVVQGLARTMRVALTGGFARADEPGRAQAVIGEVYWSALGPLVLFGATAMAVVIALGVLQLRGFLFTAHPLKPDFSRLNPAKGLKRLFSVKMLKETIKNIVKMVAYTLATWLVIRFSLARFGAAAGEGERLAGTLQAVSFRLVFVFLLLAIAFAALDQLLVRGEFMKQMRMSRREVTKEARDREGEPRIKQRRKQLHGELVAQGQGLGALPGSDLLIVNPEHVAVALRYDGAGMDAPEVTAKGRNAHALTLRTQAFRHGVPVIERPPLARALFRACAIGDPIPPERFEAVAALYIELRRGVAREGE